MSQITNLTGRRTRAKAECLGGIRIDLCYGQCISFEYEFERSLGHAFIACSQRNKCGLHVKVQNEAQDRLGYSGWCNGPHHFSEWNQLLKDKCGFRDHVQWQISSGRIHIK